MSEPILRFDQCRIRFGSAHKNGFELQLNWQVRPGEAWAVVGPNGSGKSALISALLGEGAVDQGDFTSTCKTLGVVSLEAQAKLIEREKRLDESDLNDVVDEGTTVIEMITEVARGEYEDLLDSLNMRHLIDRGFRRLSTGETRRTLIVRALASYPDLLLLDEPFEGLDVDTVPVVEALLASKANESESTMVMAFNRIDEVPAFATHILRLENGSIAQQFENQNINESRRLLKQISSIRSTDIELPPPEAQVEAPLNADGSLVSITDGKVAYTDNTVFENLNWRVEPAEHWQVLGPNGSGKTCLLNLITGDHPQCYVNDINIFGFKRGSGESIWEVKKYLGFVSTALHWDYRLSVSVRNVIISGFYDSISVYGKATDKQLALADAWLKLLGLESRAGEPFSKLSYGEQRVLLIARSMVKHPALLLLDEPCLGLDEANRQLVLALTERIAEEGSTTLVYVTHHQEDRISCIQNKLTLGD